MTPTPSNEDYRRLLELRTGLRRFLRWSERQAQAAGLTPAQHQLLLAIRGHPDPRGPTVGDVAGTSCFATTVPWDSLTVPKPPDYSPATKTVTT